MTIRFLPFASAYFLCALGGAPLSWAAPPKASAPKVTVPKTTAPKVAAPKHTATKTPVGTPATAVVDPLVALKKAGLWGEAIAMLEKRLAVAGNTNKPSLLGQLSEAHVERAYQLAAKGDGEGARLQLQAALAREEALTRLGRPRPTHQFDVWFTLARLHFQQTRITDAMNATSQALACAKMARSPQLEAVALARRADYKRMSGDLGGALVDARLALQRAQGTQAGGERVQSLLVLGMVQVAIEQPTAALRNLGDALRLARTRKNQREEAEALQRLGTALSARERYIEALNYYRAALNLYKKLDVPDSQMTVMGNIGVIYQLLGRQDEALQLYREGFLLSVLSGDKHDQAMMLTGLGTVAGQQNKYREAIGYLQNALRLWRELGQTAPLPATLANLMDCYRVLQQPGIAIFYGKAALDAVERERASLVTLSDEERRVYDQNVALYFRRLANVLISQNRLMEAEEVLRRLKSQEQSAWNRDASAQDSPLARTGTEHKTALREQELAASVLKLARRAAELQRAPQPDAAAIKSVRAQLETANHAYDTFLAELPNTFKNSEQGSATVEKIESFAELKTALEANPDAVAIYTVAANEQFSVILFSSEAQVAFSAPVGAVDLSKKVLQLRLALQDDSIDPRPLALELYNTVFCGGKVRRELDALGAKTLLWSLDGALRLMPPGALYDGKDFLARSFASVSLTRTSTSDTSRSAAEWTVLGLGATKSATVTGEQLGYGEGKFQFMPLKGVGEELKSIVREPGEQEGLWIGERLLDTQFTKTSMLESLRGAQRFPLVHIASHFHCGASPEDSFLLLGDGTPLTLAQLRTEGRTSKLFQGVELLTLSACQTAVSAGGEGTMGREVDTLGAIAQGQGARAVLASLWPISDAGTPELMRRFYELRRSHPEWSKAQTLQQAQIALLDGVDSTSATHPTSEKPTASPVSSSDRMAFVLPEANEVNLPRWPFNAKAPFSHPRYWAPFVLLGNWK